jgi:hypothetical protein
VTPRWPLSDLIAFLLSFFVPSVLFLMSLAVMVPFLMSLPVMTNYFPRINGGGDERE